MDAAEPLPWAPSCIPQRAVKTLTPREIEHATSSIPALPGEDYLTLTLRSRVYDVATETPLTYAPILSKALGNEIYLKREDLQSIFSFKCRGAFNKMANLTPAEKERGVIAASAGNHAQGVALAAQKLGIQATICMPSFAPQIKVDSVRRLGAQVILTGDDFDSCKAAMLKYASERSLTVVPPFDDAYVIAGQGTVGVEILRQVRHGRLDAIFVCVGGGGLVAGIAAYVKRVRPGVRVIGVNTTDSDSMLQSLAHGAPLTIPSVGLFTDGTAVRRVGDEPYRLCEALLDDIVVVTPDEVCAAIKNMHQELRVLLEPSGALAVAGCKKYLSQRAPGIKKGVFACVLSGANMNFDRLRFVVERSRLGERKEALVMVCFPAAGERMASLKALHDTVYPRNITELSYRNTGAGGPRARAMVCFELTGAGDGKSGALEALAPDEEIKHVVGALNARGLEAHDCTDDELAKTHARYLMGGHTVGGGGGDGDGSEAERVFRVEFTERPGNLREFISWFPEAWSVTLLHFRNHGSHIARVLIGMRLPASDSHGGAFERLLESHSYSYVEETGNAIYRALLR